MRILAFVPVVLSLAALILTFLALFAGSKQSFMQSYDIITLNTSQIGQNVLNTTSSYTGDNDIISFFHDIGNSVEGQINDGLNSLAKELGLNDFYSAHILDYCQGFYTPAAVANATVSKSDISRNVTGCSNTTAMFDFNPKQTLQRQLNASGVNVDLDDLHWPSEIDDGMKALRVASHAVFVLYCIALAFILLALLSSLVFAFANGGRLSSFANVLVDLLAFLAIGIASGIVTAVAVKASELLDRYGNEVGVSATRGGKFLGLTWAATALMLLASLVSCFECVKGRRERGTGYGTEKRLP